MKFIKENDYIFLGTLLVLALVAIIINSIYAGYQQYKIKGEPHMYGLMYVSPDGEKEYLTNTDMGTTSTDISKIAELVQYSTAEKKAKALLKNGWLEDVGGEVYVIEIVKFAVNPVHIKQKKKKAGYVIESTNYNGNKLETCYYQGPMNRDYYSSYCFRTSKTPATRFSTEAKALAAVQRFVTYLRENEERELADQKRWNPGLVYSAQFPTIVERNDFIIENFKVIKVDENF